MTAKDIVSSVLDELDMTQGELASRIGWTGHMLSQRFRRSSIRVEDFLNMLEACGVEMTLTVRETGKEIKVRNSGRGRRVCRTVDKVKYDTAASDALANNFYADGVNEYIDGRAVELYLDREGRYFFAEYSDLEGVKDRIAPVPASVAADFIEKYGTDLYRMPAEQSEETE